MTPTPESVYEQIWKPLVEKSGSVDFQSVKKLLFDYGALLQETSVLYAYITDNQITNPQEAVDDVIEIADRLVASEIDSGIRTVLGHLLDELNSTPDQPAEIKLDALKNSINQLYELGQENS
jgi:hypothetical protein